MESKWPKRTIDELKSPAKAAIAMGPFGSRIKAENFVSEGVPVLKGGNLHGAFIDDSKCDFLTPAKAQELKSSIARPGDIVVTHRGTIGQVSIIPENSRYSEYVVSQSQLKISLDRDVINPQFANYYLRSSIGQHELLSYSSQVGVPAIAKASTSIRKIKIPCPSLKIQDKIVHNLKSFDDKILLNQKINETLEKMAQAMFKSWFVDFEPVKAKIAALEAGGTEEEALVAAMQAISSKDKAQLAHFKTEQPDQYNELRTTAELFPSAMQDSELGEIPKGWKIGSLSEVIQFNPRRVLKKGKLAPYLDMKNVPTSGHLANEVNQREMNSGTKFINGDTLLARITPCLENGKTAFVDFLVDSQVGWGSTEYIVMRPQELYPDSLAYFIARDVDFRQHAIQSMTGTSGRQRANAKALAELPWLIYPFELAKAFDRLAKPYLQIARSNGNESKQLSAIRDALLPKLLSGELTVMSQGVAKTSTEELSDV